MIITYLRSSSYVTDDWCRHKYFLSWVLGMPEPANRKADKGSIVHKAMEVLGLCKKYSQMGLEYYTDPDFGQLYIPDISPEYAIEQSFELFQKTSIHNFDSSDFKDCKKWMYDAISYHNGSFDPRQRNIIECEQIFDFPIELEWAHYNYRLPDGTDLKGQLRLKGTIDLITLLPDGTLEAIDWKTGRRLNWATGEEKTYKKLQDDPQLRLYHYAIAKLFPQHKNIIVTIYYINDGGPYSLCFHESDLVDTELMIQKKFESIKKTQIPKLNITWKCNKLCAFSKPWNNTNKSICQFMKDEIQLKGIAKVTELYGRTNAYMQYGEGGGRAWDEKDNQTKGD